MRLSYMIDGWSGLIRQAKVFGAVSMGSGLAGGATTLFALPVVVPVLFGESFAVDRATALPFALLVGALSVEYFANSILLVLNRYGSRLGNAALANLAALGFAGVTASTASVALAGYVLLVGIGTRMLLSLTSLIRARSAAQP